MAIFGDTKEYILNNITITSVHTGTTTDTTVNILLGVTLLLCWITSTTLNPLVFLYNYNQKPTVARTLFLTLSAADFLTTIGGGLAVAIELLHPEVVPSAHLPTTMTLLRTMVIKPLSYLTFVITTLLCITRYIQISWPFYVIKTRALHIYITVYMSLYLIKHIMVSLVLEGRVWLSYIQEIGVLEEGGRGLTVLTVIGIIPQTAHALIAIIVSVLTIVKLATIPRMTRNMNSIRYSIAIVAMNAANTTWAVLLFYSLAKSSILIAEGVPLNTRFEVFYQDRYRVFITYGYLIYFLSAINPLILTTTSTQIKRFLQTLLYYSSKEDLLKLARSRFRVSDVHRGPGLSSNGTVRAKRPVLVRTVAKNNLNVIANRLNNSVEQEETEA